MMIKLLSKLFGKGALSPLDKLILDAVRARLDATSSVLWDKQVSEINKVQRLPDGVEVNFYRMRKGKVSFDPAIAFPNKSEELLIANVTLNLIGSQAPLIAEVWAVNGYLFSIEYRGGSRYFEEVLGMDPAPSLEICCELLADLSRST